MYRSKGETVAHVVGEYSISCHRQNIKEGMIMLRGIFIGNFVVNEDWKELVTGMNRSLREWWKVKTPKYCRISLSSATGTARQEDQTLSLLIRRERLSKIDVAIPGNDRVKDKELEQLKKYKLLKDEIAKSLAYGNLLLLGPLELYQ